MITDLLYLALTAGLATVLWIPNVVGIVAQHGVITAEDFRSGEEKSLTGWRQRAKRVHLNMTENLAHFAVLIVVAHLATKGNDVTAVCAQVFFWARLAHALVFYAGIPFVRTLAFTAGFIAEIVIFIQIVG